MSTDFEELPAPSSPKEAALAVVLGMIVLKLMRDVDQMERFSAQIGEGIAEVSGPDGQMWIVKVVRV